MNGSTKNLGLLTPTQQGGLKSCAISYDWLIVKRDTYPSFSRRLRQKLQKLPILLALFYLRLTVWRSGLDLRSYSTMDPVSAWMGDRLRAGKLSRYVTSHPGQLSLAVPPWVGVMSTSLSWEGNRKIVQMWIMARI